MIGSVGLAIWTVEGEYVEVELEAWQVSAIGVILGLKINKKGENSKGEGAYEISMSPSSVVADRVAKLKR